jgi:hypothetical protein
MGTVDRVLHDRDTVTLGGRTLTAYHIPRHTPGSTTWYWHEQQDGVTYNVADVCCWFTPANVVSDPQYPTKLLEQDWATLKSLPVDIPLPGIHHYHFDYLGKMTRLKAGEKNVWIDPGRLSRCDCGVRAGLQGQACLPEAAWPTTPRFTRRPLCNASREAASRGLDTAVRLCREEARVGSGVSRLPRGVRLRTK